MEEDTVLSDEAKRELLADMRARFAETYEHQMEELSRALAAGLRCNDQALH